MDSSPKEISVLSLEDAKKFEEIQFTAEQFYSLLESDLNTLQDNVDEQRKLDMVILEKQRLSEYTSCIKKITQYKFNLENFGDMYLDGLTLEKLHSSLLENIKKWRKLLENLDVEMLLSNHMDSTDNTTPPQNRKVQLQTLIQLGIDKEALSDEYKVNSYNMNAVPRGRGAILVGGKSTSSSISSISNKSTSINKNNTMNNKNDPSGGVNVNRTNSLTSKLSPSHAPRKKINSAKKTRTMGFGFRNVGKATLPQGITDKSFPPR